MQFQESLRAQFWVLSCMFLIYIDDITNGPFSHGTRIVLYEDDILLYRTISTNSDYSYVQSDANTVQDWVNYNHMFLNPSKCKFMLISHKRNRMNNPPAITVNGQMLETVSTFKYLGLLLTPDLSWSKHIEGICTKTKKILGLLYRQFYQHANQETLSSYIYRLYGPTWNKQHKFRSAPEKRSGPTWKHTEVCV